MVADAFMLCLFYVRQSTKAELVFVSFVQFLSF